MSHFAKVIDGIVQQVIVAEQDFIDSGAVGDSNNWTLNGAIIADMDASDTAYVTIIVGGGSKVVDFGHDGSAGYTYFSGCLLQ